MTVRILNELQKALVVERYDLGDITLQELAEEWNVSARTIGRVLDEKGVDRTRELPEYVWSAPQMDLNLIPYFESPWQSFVSFIKNIFFKPTHEQNH